METTSRSIPAASWSGLSATHHLHRRAVRVGDDARGGASSASGLTSETTSGTSGSHAPGARSCRRRPRRASAKRGAHSPRGRAAGGEEREVEALDRLVGERLHDAVALELAAGRALGGERDDLARREGALAQQPQHHGADRAGGADDGDAVAVADASSRSSERLLGLDRCPRPSSNAAVQRAHRVGDAVAADDAGDLDRRGRDHLDVDALARRASRRPSRRRPGATSSRRRRSRPCPSPGRSATLAMPSSATTGSSAARAARRSSRGTVNDMSARAPSDSRLVLDDHVDVDVRVGERGRRCAPATPGVSGHADAA